MSISIRASSLSDMLDCPARWEAKFINGKRLPSGPEAVLGHAVHAGTAVFDESEMTGAGLTIDDAAGAVVDTVHHPEEDVDWADTNPSQVEKTALGLHELYCTEISPKVTYKAVELTCEPLSLEDLGITLTGTTDRIYVDEWGDLGVADIKTGKAVVGTDGTVKAGKHAAQIAIYELLASTSLGMPITAPAQIFGLQAGKTAKGRRAGVGVIEGARDILLGDEYSPGILEIVSKMLKAGAFYGNARSMLCSEKFCPVYGTCRWRG